MPQQTKLSMLTMMARADQRHIYHQHMLLGYSMSAIARERNCTREAVRQRIHKYAKRHNLPIRPRNEFIINDAGRRCIECGIFRGWNNYRANSAGSRGHDSRCMRCKSGPKITISPIQRFIQMCEIDLDTGCWVWTGAKVGSGKKYSQRGQLRLNGSQVHAHRFSYEYFCGPIPDGLEVSHICRNTMCVNPMHLEANTHSYNMLKSRDDKDPNSCTHGHPINEQNAYINTKGRRVCRPCVSRKARERYARKKQQL